MKKDMHILHLEDNPRDAELIREILAHDGIGSRFTRATSREEFERGLEDRTIDLIISDFTLPSFDGRSALGLARSRAPAIPFIFVSGTIGEELAIQSLVDGATDYVLKHRMDRLIPAVRRAMQEVEERESRREAERALRQSEESFRLLFAANPHPMWVFDAGTLMFLEVNDAAVAKYGYTRGEFRRMRITEIRPPEDVQDLLATLQDDRPVVKHNMGWRHRIKDGTTIIVDITSHALSFAGRKAVLVVAQDITDRLAAEGRLRESEEKFRLISENVEDQIAVLDLQGKRVYNSPSFRNILGDPDSLRGTDSFSEIVPEDRERVKDIFRRTVETGVGHRTEFRIASSDGRIRHIESQGSVIRNTSGDVINVVVVSRDVTEKKGLEQQLMRAQRLESLGTLASGIAHDLNNVLAPILLSIELLRRSVADEAGKQTLSMLAQSAERGREIIKQVLTFGRGITGERGMIQVRYIVRETLSIIARTIPKSIAVTHDLPHDNWAVEGDATQIHQVLMNLCINARDAMPEGGQLHISIRNTTIDGHFVAENPEASEGRYVLLSVEDSGTGMTTQTVARIFDPFFTTKEPGKGTGLGLSTVLAIVRSHGGFVRVETEPGRGTAFRVYLPARAAAATEREPDRSTVFAGGRDELILLIDDEASVREIAKQTLDAFGYRTITASDGMEGLALFESRAGEIALVITDMMMPGMSGAKTIRSLRALKPGLKIIGSSGLSAEEGARGEGDANPDAFIAKPYTAEVLLRAVDSLLPVRPPENSRAATRR